MRTMPFSHSLSANMCLGMQTGNDSPQYGIYSLWAPKVGGGTKLKWWWNLLTLTGSLILVLVIWQKPKLESALCHTSPNNIVLFHQEHQEVVKHKLQVSEKVAPFWLHTISHYICSSKTCPDPGREVSAPNTGCSRPNLALELSGKAPTKETNHILFQN